MTERIDHAALALTLRNNIRPDEMADVDTANWLAMAQVHATLALVEQQRIANLIEIARFDHHAEGDTRLYTTLDASGKWRNEAAEALGLS